MLLQTLDNPNAQVVFQCQFVVQNGSLVLANVQCNGCRCFLTQATGCAVVDLCRNCFTENRAGIREHPATRGYSFLEVTSEPSFTPDQTYLLQEIQIASRLQQLTLR